MNDSRRLSTINGHLTGQRKMIDLLSKKCRKPSRKSWINRRKSIVKIRSKDLYLKREKRSDKSRERRNVRSVKERLEGASSKDL